MAANITKLKTCFRAVGSFLGNLLTLKFPLWLFIVAYVVCVLLTWLVSCGVRQDQIDRKAVDSAVVGYTDYHGHNYIVFYSAGSFSVTHDPDCICKLIDD